MIHWNEVGAHSDAYRRFLHKALIHIHVTYKFRKIIGKGEGNLLIKKTKLVATFLTTFLLISIVAFLPMVVDATGEEAYIVVADTLANSNYILSYGDGTFGSQEYMGQAPQPIYSYGNGIGDFDNDGDFDYVIGTGLYDLYEHEVYLYEKLGSGNDFASPISVDTWTEGWYPMDFAVADYNNDGNMDFVLTHYNSSNSELYLGNGDLTFIRSVLNDTSPLYSIGADSADVNNDGNIDFITAEYGSPPIEEIGKPDLPYDGHNPYHIYVNLGNGDGTFTTTSFEASNATIGVTTGDFDNDDNADIITAYLGGWYFYQGNGDGTFQPSTMIAGVDAYFSPIDNFDFDNDGDQDIIIGYLYSVHYYAGNGDATFTFMAEITGGTSDQRLAISAPPAEVIPGTPRAIASPKHQALPLEGGTANFDGSASYDVDGSIVTYEWDFGDGSYGTGAIVSHEYSAEVEETVYRVKLTVTDNDEKTAYHIVITKIGNTPPKVICVPWRYGLQHETWNGNPTVLKATVKDMDLPLTYTWNFGDGASESGTVTSENQKYAIEATHIYPDAPEWTPFTATLTVWDPYGASGSDMYQILVKTKTLDVEVNVAIDNGLCCLHKTQDRYTSEGIDYGLWFDAGYTTGPTSTAVLAFELQGHLPIGDANENPYVETVQRGLNHVFSQFYARNISGPSDSCPYGDPDTNGNGIGIDINNTNRPVYEIGMAMMAIAASGNSSLVAVTGPSDVVGRTYFDILTDMVDMCAWGQNEAGTSRGGWRYFWNSGNSDNSVSQWPIIGLEAAEKNWGIQAPSFVKTELEIWLSYSQSVTGGFGYTAPEDWVNPAKTGAAGMAGLAYIDVPPTDTRVVNAINYLDSQWGTSGTDGYWGNYYALYAIMKGCRLFDPEVQYIGAHDWYGDDPDGFARYLVSEQLDDRRWPAGSWAGHTLTSGWALLILTTTVVFPPPVADAGPDITLGPDWPVPLDSSGSYHLDPAKTIVLYEWDFESDGVYDFSSVDPYAEHTYPTYYNPDGTVDETLTYRDYTVTLRVTDDNIPAKTDTDSCVVHITPPPHPPIADPDGPYSGYQGQLITLDGTGSFDIDSGSPWFDYIVSYGWELDLVWPYDFDDEFGATVQWSWDVLGTHNIGLKVNDTTGLTHTAWTTVTIIPPPPEISVNLDIKPGSWPNTLQLKDKGVFPVAVLGAEDFDVTTIDPETIQLTLEGVAEGVPPLRWSYADVATPWTGEPCGGHDLEGDGYLDLTLKFKAQEVIHILGLDAFSDRDAVILILTGNLKEEHGGTPIRGQDCVLILTS